MDRTSRAVCFRHYTSFAAGWQGGGPPAPVDHTLKQTEKSGKIKDKLRLGAVNMTNAEIVYHFFKEGYENQNYDFVMSCLSDDYVDHSPAGARGNAQAVEILKIVASQFSALSVKVLDIFSDKDMVATRVLFEGIHSGLCMGIPATGRRIRFEALEHFRVADGKVVESWGYWPDKEIEEKLR